MENQGARCDDRRSLGGQQHDHEAARELSLSEEELHSLVQFFQLLDQWDRELVQNEDERMEENICRTQ